MPQNKDENTSINLKLNGCSIRNFQNVSSTNNQVNIFSGDMNIYSARLSQPFQVAPEHHLNDQSQRLRHHDPLETPNNILSSPNRFIHHNQIGKPISRGNLPVQNSITTPSLSSRGGHEQYYRQPTGSNPSDYNQRFSHPTGYGYSSWQQQRYYNGTEDSFAQQRPQHQNEQQRYDSIGNSSHSYQQAMAPSFKYHGSSSVSGNIQSSQHHDILSDIPFDRESHMASAIQNETFGSSSLPQYTVQPRYTKEPTEDICSFEESVVKK